MSALSPISAPNGAAAPSTDILPVDAPGSDVTLATAGRSFLVLTDGVVSVTTEEGNDRTFDAVAGMTISCAITHVLTATTSDLLVYIR